jgi:hypothetical protein
MEHIGIHGTYRNTQNIQNIEIWNI